MQITGGINSNDKGTNHILHHTIGRSDSTEQEIEAFRPFVCHAVRTVLLSMPLSATAPFWARLCGLAQSCMVPMLRHVSRDLRRSLCAQVQVFAIEDAHEQIDHAMATAIREQKPCVLLWR